MKLEVIELIKALQQHPIVLFQPSPLPSITENFITNASSLTAYSNLLNGILKSTLANSIVVAGTFYSLLYYQNCSLFRNNIVCQCKQKQTYWSL